MKTEKTELIVALDVSTFEDAILLIDSLDDTVQWFKVGLELFMSDGKMVMHALKQRQKSVMLDMKLKDIPETVARATRVAVNLGADMLTVHAIGGGPMMKAAVEAANGKLKILAVTVLTSLDDEDLRQLGISWSASLWARRLANVASLSGVPGLVCSAHEAAALLDAHPDMTIVTPGIRSSGGDVGDQKRVATPAFAREQGARFIVVGRPIRDAPDRKVAAQNILAELSA